MLRRQLAPVSVTSGLRVRTPAIGDRLQMGFILPTTGARGVCEIARQAFWPLTRGWRFRRIEILHEYYLVALFVVDQFIDEFFCQ